MGLIGFEFDCFWVVVFGVGCFVVWLVFWVVICYMFCEGVGVGFFGFVDLGLWFYLWCLVLCWCELFEWFVWVCV